MSESYEAIYERLPVLLQNVLCSLYGWRLHHERYGGGLRDRLDRLLRLEAATTEELRGHQDKEIERLLSHAFRHVPYYRDLRERPRIEPRAGSGMEALKRLPLLDKETVRREQHRLRVPRDLAGPSVTISTSGTSGTPLQVAVSREGRRDNYAFYLRARHWAGVSGFPAAATFGGRPIVPRGQKGPPYWRSNWRARNVLFSSYHLSEATVSDYAHHLVKLRPVLIDSYPSSVHTLAQLARLRGLPLPRPAAIVTSSETLYPGMRAAIEEAFGCKVFDQYGSAEQVAFISQCEKGSYHAHADYGVIEILDPEGRPCGPGQIGEIVATGFTNLAMPLIRYRTGDLARWAEGGCACGRAFPVVAEIAGRADDLILTPQGHYVGRLDPVFKGVDGVREAQIAQTAPDRIVVRLVADRSPAKGEGHIRAELEKRLGEGMEITFAYVAEIPRTRAGKFRAVVREIS